MVVRKLKEKCKDAARMRREKERLEFIELSKLLPLPSSTTSQLDKASIIRLTSSYLKMRNAFPKGLGGNWGNQIWHKSKHQSISNRSSTCQNGNNIICEPNKTATSNLISTTNHHHHQQQQQQQQQQQIRELGSLILQTLDGFVFALHKDGKIMYISETASVHLGLPQIDLTGSSIFEYVHSSDRNDVYNIFNIDEMEKSQLESKLTKLFFNEQAATNVNCAAGGSDGERIFEETFELPRSLCIRMKCVLPKRNAGLVMSGYKPIHCNGYLKVRCKLLFKTNNDTHSNNYNNNLENSNYFDSHLEQNNNFKQTELSSNQQRMSDKILLSNNKDNNFNQQIKTTTTTKYIWEAYALVAVGHSLLPTASTEVKLTSNSFMFRASLDLKLNFIETSVISLLGFQQVEMVNQSLYQFIHLDDVSTIETAHKSLLEKGQVVTRYYRMMKKDGGSLWMQSSATMVNNLRNMSKPQYVVGTCFILGDNSFDSSLIYNETRKIQETGTSSTTTTTTTRTISGTSANEFKLIDDSREEQVLVLGDYGGGVGSNNLIEKRKHNKNDKRVLSSLRAKNVLLLKKSKNEKQTTIIDCNNNNSSKIKQFKNNNHVTKTMLKREQTTNLSDLTLSVLTPQLNKQQVLFDKEHQKEYYELEKEERDLNGLSCESSNNSSSNNNNNNQILSDNNDYNNDNLNTNFSFYSSSNNQNHQQNNQLNQYHYQFQCYSGINGAGNNGATTILKTTTNHGIDYDYSNTNQHNQIGSIRRASDDSCSIVSSVASSLNGSQLSSSQSSCSFSNNLMEHQQSPNNTYTITTYFNALDNNNNNQQEENKNQLISSNSLSTNYLKLNSQHIVPFDVDETRKQQQQQHNVDPILDTCFDNNNQNSQEQFYQPTTGANYWSFSQSLPDTTNHNFNHQQYTSATQQQQQQQYSTQSIINQSDINPKHINYHHHHPFFTNSNINNTTNINPYADLSVSYNYNEQTTYNHHYNSNNNHYCHQQMATLDNDYTIST